MNTDEDIQPNNPINEGEPIEYHTHDQINSPTIPTGRGYARMTLSANQTLSTNGPVKVSFDTKTISDLIEVDTTNNRFKITSMGRYAVYANLSFGTSADKSYWVYIYKNGASSMYAIAHSGGDNSYISSQIFDIMDLAVGDYIEIYAGQTFNPTTLDKNLTYFTIYKL